MTINKKPISTGFPSADELLGGGLCSGELVCLAGPQTAANTRFICRAALAAAEQTEQTALLVSLCASEKEISAILRKECDGADEQLLQRILTINDNEITVEALEKRLMADDTVGTVLIDGGELINAFCKGSRWPPEYCMCYDLCDENESMKSCNIYALKKLAKEFNLPVAVTQTILDTEGKNRAKLGISPETDRLLFLRCDDQTWQFWKSDENEASPPPPDTDTEERKSPPDLLRFIPSKDVRAHLKKIGWQPDAVQAARLVLKDETVPLETVPLYEKLKVLRQIIETLPDVLLDLPSFVENGETLHECLSAYVHDEEELLASFSDNENATFLVEGYKGKSTMMLRSVVGTTLDGCLKKVLDGVPDDQRSSLRIRVCKYYTNDRYAFTVIFNADRQPILRSGRLNWKAKEIEELKREPFTLPHPFQRLDLVWAPYWSSPEQENDKRPFLLDRLPAPDAAFPNARRYASGWTVMPGGELDYFCSLPVEKLEFLPQNFPGKEEVIMKRLRRYLTGKEPLCTFVNAFAAFSLENVANNLECYDALVDFCETEEPDSPVSPKDEAFFEKAFFVCDDDLPF